MKPHYSIFYSWQSDLSKETNQVAIRHSLNEAKNKVEADLVDTRIDLNEATKNTAGSPDIANTIFDKIEACDIFVCDLTTINSDTNDKRPVPNPNVLIELGFAIATIGWDRILMLYNKAYGVFPNDLPFDIDRRRVTPFTIKNKNDKSGKGQLTVVLQEAIRLIIEKSPLKPHEKIKITPALQKREQDLKYLKLALSTINIETIDNFINNLPEKYLSSIDYFYNRFDSTLTSSMFYIYDERLFNKLMLLKTNWSVLLSFHENYISTQTKLYPSHFKPMSELQEEDKNKISSSIIHSKTQLLNSLTDLLNYVRLNYLEIDIDEASEAAIYNYYRNRGKTK